MRTITLAATAAAVMLSAAAGAATSAAPEGAAHAAVAQLRAQNDVLRERMGQMQLDLLISDVLAARPATGVASAARSVPAQPAQVVAYRK